MLKSGAPSDGSVQQGRQASKARPSPRIPTGVSDFDHITGGLPVGSVLLLAGESGSGGPEFAFTSAAALMQASHLSGTKPLYMGRYQGPVALPGRVVYVSLTRSKSQVIREVESTFPSENVATLEEHLDFVDLSPAYYADSVVPPEWSQVPRSLLDAAPRSEPGGILSELADALEARGKGSLILVDSLTDLLVRASVKPEDLVTLVKGLRRRAKDWNGLVYLMLTRHVSPVALEQALMDSVDGVLGFSWVQHPMKSVRTRALLIEKSMSVLSHVPKELHGRFLLDVKGGHGLVTTQYERV